MASLVVEAVKNPPAMQKTWVRSLGWKDPLEKGTATHSNILAWRIPWTEEPGGLQSMGSQRVGHNRALSIHFLKLNRSQNVTVSWSWFVFILVFFFLTPSSVIPVDRTLCHLQFQCECLSCFHLYYSCKRWLNWWPQVIKETLNTLMNTFLNFRKN